jgi:hypothetical protein
MLLVSYVETAAYSRQFTKDHGVPPTSMSKVHHLRSVAGALIARDERFELGHDYLDYGRIEITDVDTGEVLVLRSDAAAQIDLGRNRLFDATRYIRSNARLLVFKFQPQGLDLAVAGARRLRGRRRLVATGEPVFIGTWGYDHQGPSGPTRDGRLFDQGAADAFNELGGVSDLGEEKGL